MCRHKSGGEEGYHNMTIVAKVKRRTKAEIEAAEDEIDNRKADEIMAKSDPSKRHTLADLKKIVEERKAAREKP
jgi:hypothetical protein